MQRHRLCQCLTSFNLNPVPGLGLEYLIWTCRHSEYESELVNCWCVCAVGFISHTCHTNNLSQVYDGLRYRLSLEFPAGYPYQAPRVKFITTCFHPNVDDQGFICLDILKDKWSALYDVRSILLSIQSLLGGKTLPLFRYNFRSKSGALQMSPTEATRPRCQSIWVPQNQP